MKAQEVTNYLMAGCRCSKCSLRRILFDDRPTKVKDTHMKYWKIFLWICVALIVFALLGGNQLFAAEESETWKCLTGEKCESKTFYITFPYAIPAGTAIKVQGAFILDALSRTGSTVWTEEQWKACAPCQKSKIISRDNRAPALKGKTQ